MRNNDKYTQEMREQTAAFIIENGKSCTKTAKELGINVNTICRWVQEYRKKHNLPTYAVEKGIKPRKPREVELKEKNKLLEKELKETQAKLKAEQKRSAEAKEEVEILKKCLHIFMQPHE